jgi:hydrogenase maturation protease
MSAAAHVVIGVGNALRGDDGAGLAVASSLRARVPAGVAVVCCEQEPSRLLDAWDHAQTAIVVDAAASGPEPGGIRRFDASETAVPAGVFRSSTHAFGVGDAIELARALGRLPARVLVYGIEGGSFAAGEGLTAPVQAAVEQVARSVLEDLELLTREEHACTSERS